MNPIYAKGNKRTLHTLIRTKKEVLRAYQYRVATRLHAIMLSIESYTSGEIAHLLKVHRTAVPVWINNWNRCGLKGLLEGHRSGRRAGLSSSDIDEFKDIIESGPVAYGLNTGIWTSIILSNVIEEEFGIKYHPGHTRKLLKKIGISFQRPAYKLIKAEQAKRNKWIRYSYPNLKKTQKMSMHSL